MAKTKYLGYQGDKIKFYTEQQLDPALYNLTKTESTTKEYAIEGDEYVLVDQGYLDRRAAEREATFKEQFFKMPLDTAFTDTGFGYYRKQPKGYQSAVESMQLACTIANSQGGLPANTLIFYEEPDFYDETTVTEEWLVNHQIILPALTQEQFNAIFSAFVVAWNTQEHVNTENE